MVELEPQSQQQAALEDARGEPGVTGLPSDRSEQDRVVSADLVEHRVGQYLPCGEVALGSEVVAGLLDLHRRGRLERLERLGGHLRPDAVAADHGHPDRCGRAGGRGVGGHDGRLVVVRTAAAVVPQVE